MINCVRLTKFESISFCLISLDAWIFLKMSSLNAEVVTNVLVVAVIEDPTEFDPWHGLNTSISSAATPIGPENSPATESPTYTHDKKLIEHIWVSYISSPLDVICVSFALCTRTKYLPRRKARITNGLKVILIAKKAILKPIAGMSAKPLRFISWWEIWWVSARGSLIYIV